jgi:very-short-patch-repair endonuclease
MDFEFKEKMYIELYGSPKCLNCKVDVGFHRGAPKSFCSPKCSGEYGGGFTKPDVQLTIRKNNLEKYGVEFVAQVPEIAKKVSISKTGISTGPLSEEHKAKIGKSSKIKWQNSDFRNKTIPAIKKSLNTPEVRKFRSELMTNRLLNDNSKKLSKLHQKIKEFLGLEKLGFSSEQRVSRYCADELNEDRKIIIEINGDYVHGNPRKYDDSFLIVIGNSKTLAKDKRLSDQKRKESLEKLGYKVLVIWESDNLDDKKKELYQLLGMSI